MDIQTKNFSIKAVDDDGAFKAVIATLGVLDHDHDITDPGAFGNQDVGILPSHDMFSPSLGKARIFEKGKKVIAEGKFNLDIQAAKDYHSALKFDLENGKPLQEWSFGFKAIDFVMETQDGDTIRRLKKLDVFEISPVMKGSGIGTMTLAVKCAKRHETEIVGGVWDERANIRKMMLCEKVDYYKKIYACKAGPDWKYPHHFIDAEGVPGAASSRACIKAIAVLNGLQGETGLSEEAKQAAWDHLAGHLKDAGIEASERQDKATVKFADQILFVSWDAEAVANRAGQLLVLREKDSRRLGFDTRRGLISMKAAMDALEKSRKELAEVIEKGGDPSEAELALGRFCKTQSEAAGLTRK